MGKTDGLIDFGDSEGLEKPTMLTGMGPLPAPEKLDELAKAGGLGGFGDSQGLDELEELAELGKPRTTEEAEELKELEHLEELTDLGQSPTLEEIDELGKHGGLGGLEEPKGLDKLDEMEELHELPRGSNATRQPGDPKAKSTILCLILLRSLPMPLPLTVDRPFLTRLASPIPSIDSPLFEESETPGRAKPLVKLDNLASITHHY